MSNKYNNSISGRIFDIFNYLGLILFSLSIIYPFLYVISLSLSRPEFIGGGIYLYPKGFNIEAYRTVLASKPVHYGYYNTIIRTVAGTGASLFLMSCAAYPLSKRHLPHRTFYTMFFVFTMFFSGGLIPTFFLIRSLGLINNRLVFILPALYSTFNMLIIRNYFMTIPNSLEESAKIDGASDITILIRIILPMALPVIATVGLWTAVGHWNSWFDSLIYIRDLEKHVLQIQLRKIVLEVSDVQLRQLMREMGVEAKEYSPETVKAAMIVVTILPILMVYPFIQKYFVKGIMIGSLKG